MYQIKRTSLTFKDTLLSATYETYEDASAHARILNRAFNELHTVVEVDAVENKSLEELKVLWSDLGNVETNDNGEIETAFLHFPAGSDVSCIWHWFESQNESFAIHEMMGFTS